MTFTIVNIMTLTFPFFSKTTYDDKPVPGTLSRVLSLNYLKDGNADSYVEMFGSDVLEVDRLWRPEGVQCGDIKMKSDLYLSERRDVKGLFGSPLAALFPDFFEQVRLSFSEEGINRTNFIFPFGNEEVGVTSSIPNDMLCMVGNTIFTKVVELARADYEVPPFQYGYRKFYQLVFVGLKSDDFTMYDFAGLENHGFTMYELFCYPPDKENTWEHTKSVESMIRPLTEQFGQCNVVEFTFS